MSNKEFVVYKHTAPNGKVYIGITCKKPENRWNHGKAYWQNKYFTRAINKHGWEKFTHEILFSGLSKDEACEKEKQLISTYKSNDPVFGYNLSSGGENPAEGVKQSEESKKLRSIALTGRKFPERGKNISAAKKGRKNGLTGKVGKECAKTLIINQIDEATGAILRTFYGYNEMSRETGFARTPVMECANGIRKRAYGYLWTHEKRGKADVVI